MTIVEVANLVGLLIVGGGLVFTWIRNGRSNARSLGSMEQTLKTVVKTVDETREEVSDIGKKMVDVQVNCAKTTSAFDQKIKNLEGETFHKGKR